MPFKNFIRHQYGDAAVKTINSINYKINKNIRTSNQLTYLLRCRDNNLVPKGLQLTTPLQSTPAVAKILHQASTRLVKHQIQQLRSQKVHLNTDINASQTQIQNLLDFSTYEKLQSITAVATDNQNQRTRNNLIKKFNTLKERQQPRLPQSNKRPTHSKTVINLSSKLLTEAQTSLLAKGLKFVPTNVKKNTDSYITGIESGLQQLAPNGNIDYLRHQITNILKNAKPPKSNLTTAERKAISELRKDKSITITEADKGKAAVIMDTPDFIQLVNKTVSDTTTYKIIPKDPTAKLERKHKKNLKQLHQNNEINDTIFNQLNPINCQAPYARATIKIHKNPPKSRILVCSRGSVYYNTAQFLSRLLAPLGKEGNSYIKDSATFVSNLQQTNPSGTMVSYDVVDLFTNIPLDEALEVLRSKLQTSIKDLDTNLTIDSIIQLVSNCFDTSYFTWNDIFYQQIHGLPMGSPLSPLITEIFMTQFEEQALSTAPFKPLCWYRKVDDTFTILQDGHNPDTLLQHLNAQHPRMNFTMEKELDHQLPFLDISLLNTPSGIQTSVYRKPTHTDQYIHYTSSHHPQIKKAIVATLARRAKLLCKPELLQKEIQHLRNTFINQNGYPQKLVNKTISNILSHNEQSSAKPELSPFKLYIPYEGQVSHQVARLLKKTASLDVAFTSGKSLKAHLAANGKGPSNLNVEPKGCIYQIPCDCASKYIGETSRPLKTRLKEHSSSANNQDMKSALSEHLINNPGHRIMWDSTITLATNITNWRKRKLQEAIAIRRNKPSINRDQGVYLPYAWDNLL